MFDVRCSAPRSGATHLNHPHSKQKPPLRRPTDKSIPHREEGCQWLSAHSSIRAMSIYRRALAYYRPFIRASVGAVLLTLVAIGLGLLRPWPFAFIVDHVLPKNEENTLVFSHPGITAEPKAEKAYVVRIAPDVPAGNYDTRIEATAGASKTASRLSVLGYDLSAWSRPAIVALMCSLIVIFHLVSGLLNLVSGVMFL